VTLSCQTLQGHHTKLNKTKTVRIIYKKLWCHTQRLHDALCLCLPVVSFNSKYLKRSLPLSVTPASDLPTHTILFCSVFSLAYPSSAKNDVKACCHKHDSLFSHGTGTLRCLQKEIASYRHWSMSLWQDPDNVPHCQILSPDKTEWQLILATLCGWRRCFVADRLWFMTRTWEEDWCVAFHHLPWTFLNHDLFAPVRRVPQLQ